MQLSKLMLQQKDSLQRELKHLDFYLQKLPAGKLVSNKNSSKNKTYYKWYLVVPDEQNPGKRKHIYIPKSKYKQAVLLFLRQICEIKQKDLRQELKAIEAYLKTHREDHVLNRILDAPQYQELIDDHTAKEILKLLSRPASSNAIKTSEDPEKNNRKRSNRLKKSPISAGQLTLQNELAEWAAADFEANPAFPENLKIKAPDNTFVRSKSELIIFNLLRMNKIPFRYDALLNVGGHKYYPDFTIRHPLTGNIYYWEHVGMLDKPDYISDHLIKLRIYLNNGIIPDINLIMTYETDDHPLDSVIVEDKIKEFFSLD